MLPMKGEACSWMWPHCSRFHQPCSDLVSRTAAKQGMPPVPLWASGFVLPVPAAFAGLTEAEQQGGNAGSQKAGSWARILCKADACSSCRAQNISFGLARR